MAAALYLVTKASAEGPEKTNIDDIHACIINADDGGSDADTILDAETKVIALGHPIQLGYFDTVEKLGVETGGIMTTDTDTILILRRTTERSIA